MGANQAEQIKLDGYDSSELVIEIVEPLELRCTFNFKANKDKNVFTVGRLNQNITIKCDKISKCHCQFVWDAVTGKWYIVEEYGEYLKSNNGTFIALKKHNQISGQEPSEQWKLETDMQIVLDSTEFKVLCKDEN